MSSTAKQTRKILLIVFGVVGIVTAGLLFMFWPSVVLLADPHRNGANSIPSENMAPTLIPGDYVTRVAVDPAAITRGMVVVFKLEGQSRVSRVVGLPGDRIELRDGIVNINGQPVPQRSLGSGPVLADKVPAKMLGERFPGEAAAHRILDRGMAYGDDFSAIVVPPGRLFVLGDNRDNSADSRFPVEDSGAGLVPIEQLVGELKAIYWAKDRKRIGTSIGR